jgi:uncharacterized protein YeaO (DUF488 family)
MAKLQLKRVYEPAADSDGLRVLVDRLWPRGVKKEQAAIDLWLKDAAPSPGLRRWFGHDPDKWKDFSRRYTAELQHKGEQALQPLRAALRGRGKPVTLVYAARDEEHAHALVLRDYLLRKSKK